MVIDNKAMSESEKTKVIESAEFERMEGDRGERVLLERYRDGSVSLQGAEEVIFEGRPNAWQSALRYLEQRGYRRVE